MNMILTPLYANRNSGNGRTTSTSGQADKKPGTSSHVFAITEDQAANTSGIPLTTSCVFSLMMWLSLPMLLATMRSSMRGMMMTLSDQTNEILVMGVTRETGVSSQLICQLWFQQSRGPSEGYSYPVCTTCGRRHPGECRRAAGTCFKCGQAGHLQKDCKKNTTASTSGQANKKPGASGRVFAITEDHATKTSEHHATIDCCSYQIIFGDIHAPEFIYHGFLPGKSMQIISALQ
nr:hypothetical protein [Tanacetum cinerariifolium]